MSEKEKPIFPRSADNGTGKQILLEETKQKLEQIENKENFQFPPIQNDSQPIYHVRPAYGPPPISLFNYKLWLMLGGLLLVGVFALYFLFFRR